MNTKFKEFLNEYGGPGKTIGFRYSEPVDEYISIVPFILDENIDIKELENNIQDILNKNNVQEESFTLNRTEVEEDTEVEVEDTEVEDDIEGINNDEVIEDISYILYELKITIKAYSKYELESMINIVLHELINIYDEDFQILDKIIVKGPDLDNDNSKKIGY